MPVAVITITEEESPIRELDGEVCNYSFKIGLTHNTPYVRSTRWITKKSLVERVSDGRGILAVHTSEYTEEGWIHPREVFDRRSRVEPFGEEPISDLERIDRMLYDKIREVLDEFRAEYRFEVKDETVHSPEEIIVV